MKRYERQIKLPEIGVSGQNKLAEAKVLIIGAGGLGCPVLQNLAAAGVGEIGIVDGDIVDETNLHRQLLYTPDDCGKKKVEVAAAAVLKQNPQIRINAYADYFSIQNCRQIVSDYHLIVDCSDNAQARYLINDIAVEKKIPMVYASIHKFEGQLSVFNYQNGPTYRCLFPEGKGMGAIPDCNDSGVLGVLPGVLGSMQANEVLKIILGIGNVLNGKLLLYNSLDNIFQYIDFQKNINFKKEIKFTDRAISGTDLMADTGSLVIDIREDYEEPKLDLKSVKNVPLSELENYLKDKDKNQRIILICQTGNRSAMAVDYLAEKGFQNVFHLQGGIEKVSKSYSNGNR